MNNAMLLGIDWGTTNRRAYVLDARGKLIRQHNDELGLLAAAGNFEGALAGLLSRLELEQADVVMSGMVGSRSGWQEAPYLSLDQPIARLPDAMLEIETALPNVRCRIVPGYLFTDARGTPDVMRGEETQILGALSLSPASGWFLLPGTHSKWVMIADGMVKEIVTFMTGELFALLTHHGTLASLMQGPSSEPVAAAFEAGLTAAQHGGFTHAAFCCRALVVTDAMPAQHAWSYLSGLLIGAELHDVRQRMRGQPAMPVQIIGTPALAARYVDALKFLEISTTHVWQPDDVYVAALSVMAGIKR
jgi:2-dehydro-3-deoxygalactonokinase